MREGQLVSKATDVVNVKTWATWRVDRILKVGDGRVHRPSCRTSTLTAREDTRQCVRKHLTDDRRLLHFTANTRTRSNNVRVRSVASCHETWIYSRPHYVLQCFHLTVRPCSCAFLIQEWKVVKGFKTGGSIPCATTPTQWYQMLPCTTPPPPPPIKYYWHI